MTISADEYCRMVGKNLGDYVPRGVVFIFLSPVFGKEYEHRKVPAGTEVVVAYTHSFRRGLLGTTSFGVGTALVPKRR